MKENILFSLKEILKSKKIKDVAEHLFVSPGTINRWLKRSQVPEQYYFDILNLLDHDIDYSKFSYREKDQFYTPIQTSKKCYEIFLQKIQELNLDEKNIFYIEPSAGSGSFLNLFPEDRSIGLDIEPKSENIIKQDYLKWDFSSLPKQQIKVVIGNPPFGLRGNLALRFMKQSAKFADYVAFILPQLFVSDGKGNPKNRIKDMTLIHSSVVNSEFQYPDSKKVNVNVIFQIWSKTKKSTTEKKLTCKKYIKIVSLSDGGTSGTTRNKIWIGKCDLYIPSTCYGDKNMILYNSFDSLPGKKGYGIIFLDKKAEVECLLKSIQWSDIAFKSTNSALNLRSSIIENLLINNGFID